MDFPVSWDAFRSLAICSSLNSTCVATIRHQDSTGHRSVAQSKAVLKQRIATSIFIDRHLRHRPRPGERELAGGLVIAEEDVGDSRALRPRQPRREQRVRPIEYAIENHGPPA